MAISINTSGGYAYTNTSSETESITVASNSNRYLVVTIAINGTSNMDVSSITYAGDNLTKLAEQNSGVNDNRVEIWGLVAPSTGANNLVVTVNGTADYLDVGYMSLYGVHQGRVDDDNSSFDENTEDASATGVATDSGAFMVSVGYPRESASDGVTGATLFWDGFFNDHAYSSGESAGTITHTYLGNAATEDWTWATAVLLPPLALTETISDDFNDNSINTTLWDEYTASSGSVSESSQQLGLTCSVNTNGSWAGLVTDKKYSLIGSSVTIEVVDGTGGNTYLDLSLNLDQIPTTSNGYVAIGVNTGTGELEAYKKINDDDTGSPMATATFNATTHKYWRLRESGGTLYYEYSSDGSSWNTLYSESSPMALDAVHVVLDDYEYDALGTPGVHIFDNLNILPSATSTSTSTSTTTSSSTSTSTTMTSTSTTLTSSSTSTTLQIDIIPEISIMWSQTR